MYVQDLGIGEFQSGCSDCLAINESLLYIVGIRPASKYGFR